MSTASEYYRAGQLEQATQAALQEVKANPGDVGRRCFLADLLCFAGDLDRADRQLEAASQLEAFPGTALRRQLLRAELARRQLFNEGRPPEFSQAPGEELSLRLRAVVAAREGDLVGATQLLNQAVEREPALRGRCNGRPFEHFSDLDELTASFFEMFTATGKYYWVQFGDVQDIEFVPPRLTMDLLWRCARLTLRAEGSALPGVVYLPVLYHGSHLQPQAAAKLGRLTEWSGGGAEPFRGLGQRLFEVGEVQVPVLELGRVEFDPPGRN